MIRFLKRSLFGMIGWTGVLLLLLGTHFKVSAAPLAAIAGPNFAGSAGSATWKSSVNATGKNDNICATGDFFMPGSQSIDLTNCSFSIPSGSKINGIVVDLKAVYDGQDLFTVILLKGGLPSCTQKTYDPGAIGNFLSPCDDSTFNSLGNSIDKWGTTWVASDINAASSAKRREA